MINKKNQVRNTLILRTKKGDKEMVNIEYWNGKEWVFAGGPFENERIAWISLGGDDYNYRTIDVASGKVLTDKRIKISRKGERRNE